MAGTVIITKYSLSTGSPATDALAVGEQAYSFSSKKLFVGETSGSDVVARVIGGQLYTDMMDHTAGTLTASSAIIVDANSKIDVLNVDNYLLFKSHFVIIFSYFRWSISRSQTGR